MARTTKSYYRFSPLAFISGIICLIMGALIAGFVFLPVFAFKQNIDAPIVYKGLDYAYFGLKVFIEPFQDKFAAISSNFQSYVDMNGPNFLFKIIAQFHLFFEFGIVALFLLAAIFAAIQAILGVFWITTGRLIFPSSSKVIAWLITGFFFASLGLFAGYLFVYSQIVKELGENNSVQFSFYPIYIGGALFIFSMILHIIYVVGYKDKILGNREDRHRTSEFDIPHDDPTPVVPTPSSQLAQTRNEPINEEPIVNNEEDNNAPDIQIEIPCDDVNNEDDHQ